MPKEFDFTTTSGVRLIGAILGDGCLDRLRRTYYANSNSRLIYGFIKDAKNVFGKDLKYSIRRKSKNSDVKIVSIYQTRYGKGLENIGLIPGRKVENNPHVPGFIFSLNKSKIAEFLSQIIDDEGTVNMHANYIRIKLCVVEGESQSNLICDIRTLLSKIGIECSVYQHGRYRHANGVWRKSWQIQINSFERLERLNEMLNLRHIKKRNKLNKLVGLKKLSMFPRKHVNEIYFSSMRSIQESKGYFTANDLVPLLGRKIGHIRNMLHKYNSKGFVIKTEDVKSDGNWFYPAKYNLAI
ncbi:MAG: hypothetical protein HY051_00090 [Candidatus Aenigmarchaeota archaeon]|nr:hypothetical protein [Candidatus Aenigmarchaeota archaeon]